MEAVKIKKKVKVKSEKGGKTKKAAELSASPKGVDVQASPKESPDHGALKQSPRSEDVKTPISHGYEGAGPSTRSIPSSPSRLLSTETQDATVSRTNVPDVVQDCPGADKSVQVSENVGASLIPRSLSLATPSTVVSYPRLDSFESPTSPGEESFAVIPSPASPAEGEDYSMVPEVDHLYPTLVPIEVGRTDAAASKDEINVEQDRLEECSEAVDAASAPVTVGESGDFMSMHSMKHALSRIGDGIETLREEETFMDLVRPNVKSQVEHLYRNDLVATKEQQVDHFFRGTSNSALSDFVLWELLNNYLRAWNQMTASEKSVFSYTDQVSEIEKRVWKLSTENLTRTGKCSDDSTVIGKYEVHKAQLDRKALTELKKTLKNVRDVLQDAYPLNIYSVQLCKLQVNHYFFKTFSNATFLDEKHHPFASTYSSSEAQSQADLLRKCVSCLFAFIRRPHVHPKFLEDCQKWTEKILGLLLRVATIQDHVFVLNHVLRLPPGMVSKWASKFVQIPSPGIPGSPDEYRTQGTSSPVYIDYAVAVLAYLLNPIQQRKEYLSFKTGGMSYGTPSSSSAQQDYSLGWVVVDSEGEDEVDDALAFRESDVVALLNQIPFDVIFARGTFVCQVNEEFVFDPQILTDEKAYRLLAFFTQLTDILGAGLVNYTEERYKRLVKLLGRFILHTAQYVTDFIQSFIVSRDVTNPVVMQEYDVFLMHAVETLLRGATTGTLQFVASLPFSLVSIQMLWEMYGAITKWDIYDRNETWSEDIPADFEQLLTTLPESDGFHILTTMANMAIAREGRDNGFVRIVTTHLFQIGFLSPLTRDSCSKHARDLLGNVTRKFTHLISFLVQSMKPKMDIIRNLSLYLLKELAFYHWRPLPEDITLLTQWLVDHDPNTVENHMSRFIIQSMNWSTDTNGRLFLQVGLHRQVALSVVEAYLKWEKYNSTVIETMKGFTWRYSEISFCEWAWEIIKKFHLHVFDQPSDDRLSLSLFLRDLPTFEGCIDLEPLRKSVEMKQPFGSFVALMMTPYGHSLPVIALHGWTMIENLLAGLKFDQAIDALFHMTPMYANSKRCIEDLKEKRFLNIISTILTADQTYFNAAKSLVATSDTGRTTKLLKDMISTEFYHCNRFSITECGVVRMWMEILTSLENWNKDFNILYILNSLCEISRTNAECQKFMIEYFISLYQKLPTETSGNFVSFMFGWGGCPSYLPNSSYPTLPHLASLIFTVEMDLENSSGFWKSLCCSLKNPKESVESAAKKAVTTTKYPGAVNYLSIYRFAQQAMDMTCENSMILEFLQKFFSRFLHRVDASANQIGVGERFFEGMINTAFLKKLKRKIHDVKAHYESQVQKFNEGVHESSSNSFSANPAVEYDNIKQKLLLVNAMALWIEDGDLHKDSLYLPALPPQYLPNKLVLLLEGYMGEWEELADTSEAEIAVSSAMKTYLRSITRNGWFEFERPVRSPEWLLREGSREIQLAKRLESYDTPKNPPDVPLFEQVLPLHKFKQTSDLIAVVGGVKQKLKILGDYSKTFSLRVAQHTGVDCTFLDLLPELYGDHKSEAVVNVKCSGGVNWEPCRGAAVILFKFVESRLSERVGHLIQCNRTEYQQVINEKCLQPPPATICVAAVFIEDIISTLVTELRAVEANGQGDIRGKIITAGRSLFYDIVGALNEESSFYPPTRQMFASFLEILGSEFVGDDPTQYDNLISICANNPTAVGAIATHINLVNCDNRHLVEIYNRIGTIARSNSDLAFVLLSKLDLKKWLTRTKPSKSDRSRLISIIWTILVSDGPTPNATFSLIYGCGRNHLQTLLLWDFPNHFIEILERLIECSGQQTAPIDIWFDVLNSLTSKTVQFSLGMEAFAKQSALQKFGMETCILPLESLLQTIRVLAQHFTRERFTNGLYGLYPRFRMYIEPINLILQALSYALVSNVAKNSHLHGTNEALNTVWKSIYELFAPWLLPYDHHSILQHGSGWIKQMNFDISTAMHPWTVNDSQPGCLFVSSFCECISFTIDTIPGSAAILSIVLNFYIEHFAKSIVKEHVVGIVNNCFVNLMPWSLFWPGMNDVEAMNRVVEQYLPNAHGFLGCLIVQIDWSNWIREASSSGICQYEAQVARVYFMVMNVVVRLANDSVARELPAWKDLFEKANSINWSPLPPSAIEAIMNWYVMSVDPRVALADERCHPTESMTFNLLKCCCLMSPECFPHEYHDSTNVKRKRYLWTRTFVRLVVSVASKHKSYLQTDFKSFEKSIQGALTDIVAVSRSPKNSCPDVHELLQELFALLSNHYLGTITRNALIDWCGINNDVPLSVLHSFVNCAFDSKVPAYTVIPFSEKVIRSCFKHSDASWESISSEINKRIEMTNWNAYFEVAAKDGHFLTLHALLLLSMDYHLIKMSQNKSATLLIETIKILKLKCENQTALPLVVGILLKMAASLANSVDTEDLQGQIAQFVHQFAKQLTVWADDGSSWNILGALGLTQSSRLSINTKLYCRCVSTFLQCQLRGSTSLRKSASEAPNLQKPAISAQEFLESLKQSRYYSELEECVDYALTFVRDETKFFSVDHVIEFTRRLTCLLFTEPFLVIK